MAHSKLSEITPESESHPQSLARRALLTRGGAVVAGVAGASAIGAAVAAPASAQATTAVDMNTVNMAGTSTTPTELDAANNTTPAVILKNTGIDTANSGNAAGPTLRLTPSAATGNVPTSSTVGGDLTTTADGALWFTHEFSGTIVAAPVHTEATSNVYAPLEAPNRVLDTRTSSGRTNIVNPSGNLDSHGRLKAGKTIFINLDGLTYFAQAVFANLTVVGSAGNGYVTVWSGATTVPTASSINFSKGAVLSNFVSTGVAEYSSTIINVVAIYAAQTTHVILDVAGLSLPGYEYAKYTLGAPNTARLRRAQAAMRADRGRA